MNKVINYNITIWTWVINYFWITFDRIIILNFGPLPNFEKGEATSSTSNLVHKLTWQVLTNGW